MNKNKEKTSISIYPNHQYEITNDLFLTLGKGKLSAGIENEHKALTYLFDKLLDSIKGIFSMEEVLMLHDIINKNRKEILLESFKVKYGSSINAKTEKFNVPIYIIINNEIKNMRKSNFDDIDICLRISRNIIGMEEYQLFSLIHFLFNYEQMNLEQQRYIAERLLSDDELEEYLEQTDINNVIPKILPKGTIADIKFSLDNGNYKYYNGRVITLKENCETIKEIELEEEE
jgi:hypothetical protein